MGTGTSTGTRPYGATLQPECSEAALRHRGLRGDTSQQLELALASGERAGLTAAGDVAKPAGKTQTGSELGFTIDFETRTAPPLSHDPAVCSAAAVVIEGKPCAGPVPFGPGRRGLGVDAIVCVEAVVPRHDMVRGVAVAPFIAI